VQSTLHLSRRQSLQGLVVLGAGAALGAIQRPSPVLAQEISDEDIFRFALNLGYMEAEYYLRGTTGKGISAEDAGSSAGEAVGGHEVPFELDPICQFAEELAQNELGHVRSAAMRSIGRPSISTPDSPRWPRAQASAMISTPSEAR